MNLRYEEGTHARNGGSTPCNLDLTNAAEQFAAWASHALNGGINHYAAVNGRNLLQTKTPHVSVRNMEATSIQIQIQLACVRKRTNPQLFLTLGKQGHALQSNNKRGRERARRKNTATGARPTRQQQKGEKGQGERTQQQGHAQQGNNKEGERGLMYGYVFT
jgi:hypothetical protein